MTLDPLAIRLTYHGVQTDQSFTTSVSEFHEGRWYEGFEFKVRRHKYMVRQVYQNSALTRNAKVSYHAQLFDTIHMDLFDSYSFFADRHVGRAEIRLRHLDGLPEVFTSYYEIWDKKLTTASSSAVGRRKTLSANIGAIQSRVYYRYKKDELSSQPEKIPDLQPPGFYVTTSQSLITEEQIANEFERHLKFQRERNKTGITFRKYEEGNEYGENNLENYEEFDDYDDEGDEDEDAGLSRPLSSKPEKKLSEATLTGSISEKSTKSTWSSYFGFGNGKKRDPSAASSTRTSSSATLQESRSVNAFGGMVDDDDTLKSYPLLDTLGAWTTTKETNQVLRSIGKLLAAFVSHVDLHSLSRI
jgi:hypothetical protein